MTYHELKVLPPYMHAVINGDKTFEVRKNDRGYQRGDVLRLREWHPCETNVARYCVQPNCGYHTYALGHWYGDHYDFKVTYVYAGDPRFGGIEQGYVVLGLTKQ